MKISVVIPTFNRAFCIERAINSVLMQSYCPFEIIVCDDGSTDNTHDLIAKFPIRYLFQENQGVSAARNLGVKASRGEWIAFLDSDDFWHKRKLELQVRQIENTNLDFCHTNETWIRNGLLINPKKHLIKSNENLFERSLKRCVISTSSALVKKKLLLDLNLFDTNMPIGEDYDLWLRLLVANQATFVPDKLVTRYAGHNDQLSNQHSIDRYRIQTLKKLLVKTKKSLKQQKLIKNELLLKSTIYEQGSIKRTSPRC